MKEEWRLIRDENPLLSVSNYGRVRRNADGFIYANMHNKFNNAPLLFPQEGLTVSIAKFMYKYFKNILIPTRAITYFYNGDRNDFRLDNIYFLQWRTRNIYSNESSVFFIRINETVMGFSYSTLLRYSHITDRYLEDRFEITREII